jgi:hypothetical protein
MITAMWAALPVLILRNANVNIGVEATSSCVTREYKSMEVA